MMILAAESKIPAWVSRYTNTIIITLMWPCVFLGFIYLAAFFILNSSYGPKILHSQLSGFLRGDYFAETMKTDAFLQTLKMTNVRLSEAGKEEAVIWVPYVEAKIPIVELVDLITSTTLTVGRIKAYDADVYLDFTHGELNILKVVLPYASMPEPPDPVPGNFVTNLADLNATNTAVHLVFDGFRIDLYKTEVDHYAIRAGSVLEMTSPRSENNGGQSAIRVGEGVLTFNPALFSFSLASVGDADEGLVMSGGPGSSGKVGYAYNQMARHIEGILREDPAFLEKLGLARDMRGNFIVPLTNTEVDGFHWQGNTFTIPKMSSGIGDGGSMHMTHAMMNVGPTQQEIDEAAQEYHHKPSGLLPEESVLWAAKLDLNLKVSDPILTYFFGPILHGDGMLQLNAAMAGDLARVSGDIALDMPEFETFNVDLSRASLRAHMDGQHLGISAFEADTAYGGVLLGGYYEIMDGNFDFDIWAGMAPEDPDFPYIDASFGDRLKEGMTPLDFLPDGNLQHFSGLFSSHLKAQSQDGEISLSLPEPMQYRLDQPLAGVKEIVVAAGSAEDQRILTYQNGIVSSPGGLNASLGKDTIHVAPGLRLDTNNLTNFTADVSGHIESPAHYAEHLGIMDFQSGPVDFSLKYFDCNGKSCGGVKLKASKLSYMGIDVPVVDIDLALKDSKLSSPVFKIETPFGHINAEISSELSLNTLSDYENIPFHVVLRVTDVDLENMQFAALEELDLHGKGEGTLTIDGPYKKLKARLLYTMTDLEAMDVPASRLLLLARYEDKKVYVPALNLWFGPSELSPEEAAKQEQEEAEQRAKQEQETQVVAGNLQKLGTGKAEEMVLQAGPRPPDRGRGDGNRPRVRRRTPDFSLGALTYDLEKNTVIFNVALQPVSPNDFEPFRALELPVEGQVSFDISANIDLDMLTSGNRDISQSKEIESTWVEGELNLNNVTYGDMYLGNTQIQMSRSAQYALIKGNIIDTFELSGFVRTAPHFSASLSLNFPELDVLKTLSNLGIDMSNIVTQFAVHDAMVSGSVGFCMKSLDDMKVSLLVDDIEVDVLGNMLSLTQPALVMADLADMSANLRQLELKYRDSVLKMSGKADMKGNVDFDLNGEVDAAIVRSVLDTVERSSGLLGISLSARGNMFYKDKLSFHNLELSGYLGVRDPIEVKTSMTSSPVTLSKGFFIIGRDDPRCKSKTCVYTPEDQGFTVSLNDQTIALNMFASSDGMVDLSVGGMINASIVQMFMKDAYETRGSIDILASLSGSIVDKSRNIVFDPDKIKFGGHILVNEPVSISLRSFNDPITLDQGALLITEGSECSNNGQCVVIPKTQGFKGNLMGGSYLIFGEVGREAITPKGGNLSITANNVSFRMKDELFLTVSPDIQITAKDFSDFETVKVAGDIDIAEAKYKKDFDDGSSNFIKEQILSMFIDSKKRVEAYSPSFLRRMPQLGKINLDIGVSAENSIGVDVKIATAVVELELGTQLRIGGTVKEFAPTGIISINQGVFTLRDNDFEFQSGAQVAFNGSLDGKIDVTATTEISTDSSAFSSVTGNTDLDRRKRISTSNANSSDLYAITLTVGGTVFKPVWSFESSPYLTDTNVYALILTGRTIEDFSGNDVAMESLLSPLFTSQLDTFINADQFKFVLSEGAAQFAYVKQINKGLRVAAAVSIRGAEGNEQALSAEYYFNDNWFVDLTGQNTSDEKGRAPTLKLGGRLHWHLPIE